MAIFPVIQNPCPYKGNISSIMDGDVCRLCKRQVFDLTSWSDDERVMFLKNCNTQVCVTYRFPVRAAAAAAVAIAAIAAPVTAVACDSTDVTVVVVGGIKDPANVKFVENSGDKAIPALPVVYESKSAAEKQMPMPQSESGSAGAVASAAAP